MTGGRLIFRLTVHDLKDLKVTEVRVMEVLCHPVLVFVLPQHHVNSFF